MRLLRRITHIKLADQNGIPVIGVYATTPATDRTHVTAGPAT
jgi:hypothetical protein